MRTKKKKGKERKKKTIQPTTEPHTCMNTYGNCKKTAVPIIYASREGKEFTTNHFCSRECLEMYKYQGRGQKKVRDLAKKVYEKQDKEYKLWLKTNEGKEEKPNIWKDTATKKKYDCSFKLPQEKLKDKVKYKKFIYKLDKTGKYPEYKLLTPKVKETAPTYSFNKKWISINPNKVNKLLLTEAKSKLIKGWYEKSLKKWKIMPKSSLEHYLFTLIKNPKQEAQILRLSNEPVRGKTADGKDKVEKTYWKMDYLFGQAKIISKNRFPVEIGYYLLAETYQELYSENLAKIEIKTKLGGKKYDMPKVRRR